MKRLLLILPLLCLAADTKNDLDNWKETRGKWNREGGVLHTNDGVLVYPCEGKRSFTLSCKLFIHEWQAEPSYLMICWALKGTCQTEPNWEDRQSLFLNSTKIIYEGPPKQSVDAEIPLKKPIPVTIKSTSGKTEITVGKTRLTTHARYSSPDKLGLVIRNADAEIRDLQVKTK